MLDKAKMISKKFDEFIDNKENFYNYCEKGYTFFYNSEKSEIIIHYLSKKYIVNLIIIEDKLYWHLIPYNHSVFNTKVDKTGFAFKMVLFAIKEDFELYS